jgi:hypothetical protein
VEAFLVSILHFLVLACPACAQNAGSPGLVALLPALLATPFLVAGAVVLAILRVDRGGRS